MHGAFSLLFGWCRNSSTRHSPALQHLVQAYCAGYTNKGARLRNSYKDKNDSSALWWSTNSETHN